MPVHTVIARDLKIAYAEVNPHAPGLPLLLVHGNWSSHVWWESVMQELAGRELRALAYTLRGRGQTEGPDNEYTIAEHAADLFAFADALGIEQFHLAGHSLGTAIAMQAALERPDRVRSLAAFAPSWIDGMPAVFNHPEQQRVLSNRLILEQALAPLAPTLPKDASWRRCVDESARQRVVAAERNLAALVAWRPGDALRALEMPRAVISGSLDVLTRPANARRVAEALRTDLVVFDGVGHCVPLEAPTRSAETLWELTRQAS